MPPDFVRIFLAWWKELLENQMNKDQITNPLDAIRGRVPD